MVHRQRFAEESWSYTEMKVVRVLLAVVLIVLAVVLAFRVLSSAIGIVLNLIFSLFGLVVAVAVIGGLGWAILRLLGRKPLGGGKTQILP